MKNTLILVISIILLTSFSSQSFGGLSSSWNKFREKHIDPVGDTVPGPSEREQEIAAEKAKERALEIERAREEAAEAELKAQKARERAANAQKEAAKEEANLERLKIELEQLRLQKRQLETQ